MRRQSLLAAILLCLLTVGVFLPVVRFDFVHWDDDAYVLDNPRVQAGLNADNVAWAFTTIHFGYYYPLTWLSHMVDCGLYGLWAGGHHATSLLFHVANVLLLFAALSRMTGAVWRSAIVAALFAVHPQHVESVAWIAERKDVLSTFFGLLAILAYARYARQPSVSRYVGVLSCFFLGLLAKPMIVTLPAILLLIDYWPLGRWPSTPRGGGWRLVREKLPLLAAVPLFGALTYVAQRKINAVASVDAIPIDERAANALISGVGYIVKMFAPIKLTAFYTHPRAHVSFTLAVCSAVALLAATVASLRFGRRHRYLAVGWLWYLVALAPVIGLIQVGDQSSADRYTYFAFVGLFLLLVWGAAEVCEGWLARRPVTAGVMATAVVLALALRAHDQVAMWKDSETLFTTMVSISPDAPVAFYNLGKVRDEQGRTEDAVASYTRSVELDPRRVQAWTNLGIDLHKLGRKDEALKAFLRADEQKPGVASTKFDIGLEREALEQLPEALAAYAEAMRLDPSIAGPQGRLSPVKLGALYEKVGRWPEARDVLERATRSTPDDAESFAYLALAYQNARELDKAAVAYREAIRLNPSLVICRYNLGILALKAGDAPGAAEQLEALETQDAKLAQALRDLIRSRVSGGTR